MKALTDAERIVSIRDALRAANGDWHELTNLWSIGADLTWLLERAEGAAHEERGRLFNAVRQYIREGIDAPGVIEELHAAFYEARDRPLAAHEERGLDVDIAAALGYELRSDGASTQRALNEAGLAIVRLAATPEAAPDANSVEISGELAPAPTTEERDHA